PASRCFSAALTAAAQAYALPLHDALPIFRSIGRRGRNLEARGYDRGAAKRPRREGGACEQTHEVAYTSGNAGPQAGGCFPAARPDRKSTRLNSSHDQISYAVFCLKKKKPE